MTEDPLAKRPSDKPYGAGPEPTQVAGGAQPPQQPPSAPSYGAPQPPPAPSYGLPPGGFGQPAGPPSPFGGGQFPGPFYLSAMGGEQGPLDFGQLAQMAQAGSVKGDTMVRSQDNPNWFPAKQVPGLFSDKEWLTTLLIALFLGAFGIDRFYLGYTGLGVAKLVVCIVTCGIGGAIWGIIDLIMIATRKLPDAQGRPLA